MSAAGLHGHILLRTDGIGHGRALQGRAEIDAPELFELFVIICDERAVLQRCEDQPASGRRRSRPDLDLRDGFRDHLVVLRVEGGDGAVIKIAGIFALLAVLGVEPAVRRLIFHLCAVLREAALSADAIGDALDGIIGHRLMRDAAVPGRTCPLVRIATQGARLGDIFLHFKARVVFHGLAGLGVQALRPVQVVDVFGPLDEAAVEPVQRIKETVAAKVADHLAVLALDHGVVDHMDPDLVIIPGIVRRILEVPFQLTGFDVQRDR